ncbi:UNVERIFIED_CONTAM: hypothetical protein Sradi_7199000 [Sesamum radiatum]|uniref:Integrase catalytic domain-containing protein n=1 Tax=Sesamum radiatum TaxID=300843 RepID=A0AAW2IQP9_SESRA
MTNEIQKQYDKLEDVPSIMLRMKEVYTVPDRHIRYAATKAFFGTKMAEGSSMQSHRVKMLSLMEKLEVLKGGLNNDTYIDVILQFLPPSYDPFIVNYNMNGLEKSIHELINMLVQYEATTHQSEPAVLVGEASTSKTKGKGARRWKRKKSKGTAATAPASTGGAPAAPKGKGKGKVGVLSGRGQIMCACISKEMGIGRGSVLQPRKMTKNPFAGQSAIANGLLDLVHTDVCGSLSVLARGGFSYYITFTHDHSRYGYVYMIRYKSEAFGRFKEYRLEVENQTNHIIKALRSDRCGEYLSGEFTDYLKENGILSQWTPPGMS